MGRFYVYKRGSEEYEKFLNEFIDNFESTFPYRFSRDFLRSELRHNIRSLHKQKDEDMAIKLPFHGFLEGFYARGVNQLRYVDHDKGTKIHETLHALTARAFGKREKFKKFILGVFFKKRKHNVRALEEGMTEFFAACMQGEHHKKYRFGYYHETEFVYRLAKIYGEDIILDYYLGKNNDLVQATNKDVDGGFDRIVELCAAAGEEDIIAVPFEPTFYHEKKRECKDNLLFDLYRKKHMVEAKTIEDFKINLDGFFDFYDQDMYRICIDVLDREETPDKNPEYQDAVIRNLMKQFKKFNEILDEEWSKLGIDDMTYFYSLLSDKIKSLEEPVCDIMLDYADAWNPDFARYLESRSKTKESSIEEKKRILLEAKKTLSEDQEKGIETPEKQEKRAI